jgi:fibronectin-binding autotransporter adhesin
MWVSFFRSADMLQALVFTISVPASAPAVGVYNLTGGVLATSSISQLASANITSTVNFNGGTLLATLNNASLLNGLTHAYVRAGGLTLNASIGAVSLSQSLLHDPTVGAPATDGGLTLVGGQLTMNASSNTYTGPTNITGGGLLIAGAVNTLSPASAINISAGTLDVTGYNNSISAITVGSAGALDLSTTKNAVLTDNGAASFGGTLSVAGNAPVSLPYTLVTYSSYAGSFASTSLPVGTFLAYTANALELTNGTTAANLVYLNTALQWDTGNTSAFNGSSGPTVFHTGDNVTFNDGNPSGPYTVTISGTVSPGSTTFNNSAGNYAVSATNSSSGIAGSGGLLKLGTGSVSLAENNSYTGGTNVAAGTLIFASATAFPANTALNISTGAKVVIANHGTGSVFAPVISSFSNTGILDITNNALVLHNASLGTISSEVASAYNNGAWNGTSSSAGIMTSSLAAADTSHLHAVGVATGLSSFPDASVLPGDVVVKYTYYGDTNLDGKVDGTDYSRIDNGYLTHATGWYNGDFNYDGVINGSDYTLIDNACNMQGASLAASVAAPTARVAVGASAVPEPTTLGLAAMAAMGLLGRRQRRQ